MRRTAKAKRWTGLDDSLMAASQRSTLATLPDLVAISYMIQAWLATGLLPRRSVPALAVLLARAERLVLPGKSRRGIDSIERRLGAFQEGREAAELWRTHLSSRHEHILGRVLELHRRRWCPTVEVAGLEHLQTARRRGRGAILWVMSFCGPLVFKIGLKRSGVPLTHLSAPWHGGFSSSWVALELLNRWAVRAEAPYLEDRIVVPLDRSRDYFHQIEGCLEGNGVLSIQAEHRGRRHNVEISVLGETVEIATGAPFLAARHDAVLLTLATCRTGPFEYRVTLQQAVELSSGLDAACDEFGRRLEQAVRHNPSDWERWSVADLQL